VAFQKAHVAQRRLTTAPYGVRRRRESPAHRRHSDAPISGGKRRCLPVGGASRLMRSLRVRSASHSGVQTDGPPVDNGQKRRVCLLCASTLSERQVRLDVRHSPRCKQKFGRQPGVGIVRLSPHAFGKRSGYDLREFIPDSPRPSLEGLARLRRFNERLAPIRKFDGGTLFGDESMSEKAICLDRSDGRLAVQQSIAEHLAPLVVAIEEHVLFTREVIEDRHSSDVRSCGYLVDCHVIEAALDEQSRSGIRDALSRSQPLS
jgi:hypothetical protein